MRDRLIGRISTALLIAAAAVLAGCGTAPRPFSLEEKIWFDKAQYEDKWPGYPYYPDVPYGPQRYVPADDAPPFAPYPPGRYRG